MIQKNKVYDDELESVINDLFKKQMFLEEDSLNILVELNDLYEKTNYPGILYYLGECYFYGKNKFEKDETIGLKYLKQAANLGYINAIQMLGDIYTSKAIDYLSNAYYYYELDEMNCKFELGLNLMASYLINSSTHYNDYDKFYTGLGMVAESYQRGNIEANIILNVLNKGKIL